MPNHAVTGFPPIPAKKRSIPPARKVPPLAGGLFTDLIGKPFVDGGRGPENYDCVGLVLAVAARMSRKLPDYLSTEAELHAQLASDNSTLADLPAVTRPAAGDVALLRVMPGEHHLGVLVDPYRMIHASRTLGVVVERLYSPLWHRRIVGFYALPEATR